MSSVVIQKFCTIIGVVYQTSCFDMGNCLKSENIAENVQFFNQLDPMETKCTHSNSKERIYCIGDKGHGILMLYVKYERFTGRICHLWPKNWVDFWKKKCS